MRVSEHHVHGGEFPIKENSPCFKIELEEFYGLLCGDKQRLSYENFIAPVFVLNAIQKSLDTGKEELVNKFEL